MGCQDMQKLQAAWKSHREAAMFLNCGKAITNKLLFRACRADQASTGRAIFAHQRSCGSCSIPHQ